MYVIDLCIQRVLVSKFNANFLCLKYCMFKYLYSGACFHQELADRRNINIQLVCSNLFDSLVKPKLFGSILNTFT